jgi:hypothetical protein
MSISHYPEKADGSYCLVCGEAWRASNSQQQSNPPSTTRTQGTSPITGPQGVSPVPEVPGHRSARPMMEFRAKAWHESESATRKLLQALDQLANRDPHVAEILGVFGVIKNITDDRKINLLIQGTLSTMRGMAEDGIELTNNSAAWKIFSLIELHRSGGSE